jgi:tetratricopeptide (TPR) repeat protein
MELGRAHHIANVEISALINLGYDYLALGQYPRALSYLEPTLERVQREGLGVHKWRWTIRLLVGLAALAYTTEDDQQALRYVAESLKEAQATASQKYVALSWALHGKIAARLGDAQTAGIALHNAYTLAEQLHSPSLTYPLAYELGHWYEGINKEQEAAAAYRQAQAAIARMVTTVEDDRLRSVFLQSTCVHNISACAARLGVSP